MRKTKIICTIGPASQNIETLTKMCMAGMNVARLNFSHGDHEEQYNKIRLIQEVRKNLNLPIAIMLDTKGPEYRIGAFENGKVTLKENDTFSFVTEDVLGDQNRVSVNYKNLPQEIVKGDRILVNNGLIICEVLKVKEKEVICRVVAGGVLSDKKSMNFPNKILGQEYLSENDKKDLLFGIQNDVDFVAASFVSCRQDVIDLRTFLDENGGSEIEIIAKIENRAGIDNIDEICEVADGIMIARGDLGVEIPFMELPSIQKYLIDKCRLYGTRVITATEMLESMIQNPRPTRAELSDVANAVYDGTSAIMLSGETAMGKYPVESVRHMAEIARYTEEHIDYRRRFKKGKFDIRNNLDAISRSVCSMAFAVNAKAIVVSSISGRTARMVSRFRCPVPILGMTMKEKVWRKLNLSWGVKPLLCQEFTSMDVMFYNGLEEAKDVLALTSGDNVVLTGGQLNGKSGNTNTIKVETIP